MSHDFVLAVAKYAIQSNRLESVPGLREYFVLNENGRYSLVFAACYLRTATGLASMLTFSQ